MTHRLLGLLAPTALALLVAAAAAQEGTVLDAIVVTGPDDAPADDRPAVSTVDATVLQGRYQGAGIATVLNAIAGVTTQGSDGDPAIAVNIRGLQGDGRVAVTIDGARQNFARSGHNANGTFYADPEMLRSMTVTRGPSGSAAAAGAIGGTLALHTVTAADLIAEGAQTGTEARLRYGTLNAQTMGHLAFAAHLSDRSDAVFAVTSNAAADYHSGDGTLVHAANESLSGLAKLSFAPTIGQKLTLSLSQISSDFKDGWVSGILRQNDMVNRSAMLDYDIGQPGDTWTGTAKLYRTTTKVSQYLLPDGAERSYETATTGLKAAAFGALTLGNLDHDLTLSLDSFRDGVTTDDPTNLGGSLTPSGHRTVWSLLAQDQIALTPDTTATLGLRQDGYSLSSPDGAATGRQTSPSLTLSHSFGAVTLFGTLARAYRPPTLSEALVNGQHPEPADFYIRPNPDLAPESALSQEIGASLSTTDLLLPADTVTGQLSVFQNDVRDYIGLVRQGGLFNGYYQYDNIDRVRIQGLEAELAYDAGWVFAQVSAQRTMGTDMTTGADLSGVAPDRATLTAGLRSDDRLTEIGARLTRVAARDDGQLTSVAWHTVDLFLTRDIADGRGQFALALNNIADADYTQYLNTQPSPGVNIAATLTLRF